MVLLPHSSWAVFAPAEAVLEILRYQRSCEFGESMVTHLKSKSHAYDLFKVWAGAEAGKALAEEQSSVMHGQQLPPRHKRWGPLSSIFAGEAHDRWSRC